MTKARVFAIVGLAVLGVAPVVASAQQPATIGGTVKNEAGLPIAAAQVSIVQIPGVGAVTRENGKYALLIGAGNVRGQQVTLVVRAIGYKADSVKLTLNPGLYNQDVTLVANPLHLGETVITGAGTATTNEKLGNVGKTVFYSEPVLANPVNQAESLKELVADMRGGKVDLLVWTRPS